MNEQPSFDPEALFGLPKKLGGDRSARPDAKLAAVQLIGGQASSIAPAVPAAGGMSLLALRCGG